MERSPRGPPPTHLPSPTASTTTTTTSSSNAHFPIGLSPRSDSNNPYPTTFVQADTSSFKQVVQMLTGSSETAKLASQSKPTSPDPAPHHAKSPIPPIRPVSKSKLYERRNSLKNLRISPLVSGFGSNLSPRNAEILSPSLLDFPSLALSPVTPLISDPFNRSPPGQTWNKSMLMDRAAEEKAIAEKGFFLHPSPRDSEPPKLLPLFPLTSPKHSGSSDYSRS